MPPLDFEQEKINFREYYNNNKDVLRDAGKTFQYLVERILHASMQLFDSRVIYRIKEREECIKKFQSKYLAKLEKINLEYEIKDHISDLIGVRVICLYVDQIDLISKELKKEFHVIEETNKTLEMEKQDNTFGYKGLHLDLCLNDSRKDLMEYEHAKDYRFEIQIRTLTQDAWSNLDHKVKYKKRIPYDLRRQLNIFAALFELADREFKLIRESTSKLMEESEAKDSGEDTSKLDSFVFLSIAKKHFPEYRFEDSRIDDFVYEVLGIHPSISPAEVNQAIESSKQDLCEYKEYLESQGFSFNPYTHIRHALFLTDKKIFESVSFNLQRQSFEKWNQTKLNNMSSG